MPGEFYSEVGKQLRKRRRELKVRQDAMQDILLEFGLRIGTSTYQSWELGVRAIPFWEFIKTCQALRVDPRAMLGRILGCDQDEPPPSPPPAPCKVWTRLR